MESVKKGTYIVRQGQRGDKFYIVTDGEVAVTITAVDGTEKAVTHLYPGHFFGETSIVNEAPRNGETRLVAVKAAVLLLSRDFCSVSQPTSSSRVPWRPSCGSTRTNSRRS